MFIVPINSAINSNLINSISSGFRNQEPAAVPDGEGKGFRSFFQEAVVNAEKTEAVTRTDAYNLSIGNMDDLHTMMINASKADLALQTVVQLRNKVLDAYSEIMRTNL